MCSRVSYYYYIQKYFYYQYISITHRSTSISLAHEVLKKGKVKVAQSCPTLCNSPDQNSPGQNTGVDSLSFSRESSQPRDQTHVSCVTSRFFTLWADFLPAELQGKPKNTGAGSRSLLQQIFPTQESNQGLCIAGRFFTNRAIREMQLYITFKCFKKQLSLYSYI